MSVPVYHATVCEIMRDTLERFING
jgi:hypothetical protein